MANSTDKTPKKSNKSVPNDVTDQLFSTLAEKFMPMIQRLSSKYYGDSSLDQDDFIQEGLTALHRACNTFSPDRNTLFSTYAYQSIQHAMIDLARKYSRSKVAVPTQNLDLYSLPHQSQPTEEQALQGQELLEILSNKEQTLSLLERRVLLEYVKGSTYDEIGKHLQIPKKSVDNALQRVRRKLRPF